LGPKIKSWKKTCLRENMDIDIKLNKVGLQIIMNFHYYVGDCLFDVISYLLNYSLTSSTIWQNCIAYL
jgi:hypothetical protein